MSGFVVNERLRLPLSTASSIVSRRRGKAEQGPQGERPQLLRSQGKGVGLYAAPKAVPMSETFHVAVLRPYPAEDSSMLIRRGGARDCIAFGKQFLQISGLEARGPRRVPVSVQYCWRSCGPSGAGPWGWRGAGSASSVHSARSKAKWSSS